MNREKLYSAADLLKRKKKIVIPAAIFTVAAAAFLAGRGGKSSSPVAMGMGQMNNVATVSAEYPKSGDIKLETAVTGTVEPADVVYVYAQESGDVTSVQVKAGDVVEAGQVLLTIDTKQVESAKNSMDSAKISYDQAQSTLNRMQLLYARSVSLSSCCARASKRFLSGSSWLHGAPAAAQEKNERGAV